MPHAFTPLRTHLQLPQKLVFVTGPEPSLDEQAGALLFASLARAQGHTVDVVLPSLSAPQPPLPTATVHATLPAFRTLDIAVPIVNAPLAELSYRVDQEALHITITPKHGSWDAQEVRTTPNAPRYTLLIAGPSVTPKTLAALSPQESEWFRAIPSIYLQTRASSSESSPWSTHTLADSASLSLSDSLMTWLEQEHLPLTQEQAQIALTGIIAATNGFRDERLESDTLARSARLIEAGADRQSIMNALWRTESVQDLNLWGRALMRTVVHASAGIASCLVSEHDFLQCGVQPTVLPRLGSYLLTNFPDFRGICFLYQWNGVIRLRVCARETVNTEQLFASPLYTRDLEASGTTYTVQAQDLVEAQAHLTRHLATLR